MKPSFRRVRMAISCPRLLPHIIIMLCAGRSSLIRADLIRWAELLHMATPRTIADFITLFITLMTFKREYRTVFYLRAGAGARVLYWLCPRMRDLDIERTAIGPGLFIQHGNSTFVSAQSIGANCWIGRHVVIGYSNETDRPTIGNNVRIFAGAKIIGNVTIGDNATIGLNTVVAGNVSPDTTVLGVPGRAIWRAGG
jgi:serine O-acetyltransferase